MTKKTEGFNDFRFSGLNWFEQTNKYLSMERVSKDESKIVVKVDANMIKETKFGYALILDMNHVVFLKPWQVSDNYYGVEVLLNNEFWEVKEWGNFTDYGVNEENYEFDNWKAVAIEQQETENIVKWEK